MKVLAGCGVKLAAAPARSAAQVGVRVDDRVEPLAVVRGNVLDVGHVLEPALDLERSDAGVYQRAQVVALVVVLERQQVLVVRDAGAVAADQCIRQTAGLRAVATLALRPVCAWLILHSPL